MIIIVTRKIELAYQDKKTEVKSRVEFFLVFARGKSSLIDFFCRLVTLIYVVSYCYLDFCSSHVLSTAEKTQFISSGWVNSRDGTVNKIVNQPNTFRSLLIKMALMISVEFGLIGGSVVVGGTVVGDIS